MNGRTPGKRRLVGLRADVAGAREAGQADEADEAGKADGAREAQLSE
jgi:hypothetical protein